MSQKTPLIKDTLNASELNGLFGDGSTAISGFLRFAQCKKVRIASKGLAALKTQGFAAPTVLLLLLLMPLLGLPNVNMFMHSELASLAGACKDVYYRLLNDPMVEWRRLHYGFVKAFLSGSGTAKMEEPSSKAKPTCFILDDTIGAKTGRHIEGTGMLFDHSCGRFVLGLKYLFVGFWDGSSFIPLDFSIHRERGKNSKKPFGLSMRYFLEQTKKKWPSWTAGFKRRKELDTDKISAAIKMLKRAAKNGITADYLLVDSWFVCDLLLSEVYLARRIGHLLGQAKNDRRKYAFQGAEYTGQALKKKLSSKWKRCKRLRMQYLQVDVVYKDTPVRLYFTRQHGCQKERLLLTTDRSLSFTQAFDIYAIRWTIEVYFKEAKQLLKLGKCQSTSFDAQIAAASICMMQYTALAHQKRIGSYRTLGGLFRDCKQEASEALLNEKIIKAIISMLTLLGETLGLDWEKVLRKIISDEAYSKTMAKIMQALADPSPTNENNHNTLKKSV